MIRVGVIGVGFAQQVHVPAFRADGRCVVEAICASTAERAQRVARQLEVPRAFGDWRALVAEAGIDAVSIAVPTLLQPAVVEAAARAGKHVLCEKPLAPDVAAGRGMVEAVEKAGVVHAIDLMLPEIEAWRQAQETIRNGALGEIRHAAVSWRVETYAHRNNLRSWKTLAAQGGGALNSFASHTLYSLEWLLGPMRRLSARLVTDAIGAEAGADLWLETRGGAAVNVAIAANAFAGSGHRVEIYGSEGSLVLENATADYVQGFTLKVTTRKGGVLAEDVPPVGAPAAPSDGRVVAFARIVRRFVDAIVGGKGAGVTPNLRDGLRVQELLDAAREANRTGAWVEA